jgi:hypothetical protein
MNVIVPAGLIQVNALIGVGRKQKFVARVLNVKFVKNSTSNLVLNLIKKEKDHCVSNSNLTTSWQQYILIGHLENNRVL